MSGEGKSDGGRGQIERQFESVEILWCNLTSKLSGVCVGLYVEGQIDGWLTRNNNANGMSLAQRNINQSINQSINRSLDLDVA